MNLKKVVFATMTLAMVSGSAVAGSTSALDDPAKMSPFFTDAGMKTMKSEAEAKAAWAAMSQEDRDAIMKDCADATIAKAHENFCKMAIMMGK
jgi:acyl-CoA reductase-like NAD-dependent aldehyde dehydrogenase